MGRVADYDKAWGMAIAERARRGKAKKQAMLKKAGKSANKAWTEEYESNRELYDWGDERKDARGYDPVGFMGKLVGGGLMIRRRDASGEGQGGIGPLVLRKWQMKVARELVEHRRTSTSRWLELVMKPRQLGWCLDPATRVLCADLRWRPISEISIGDEVVALDEHPPGGRGASRKMRTARVVRTFAARKDAYRITMEDGRAVICTAMHPWLSKWAGERSVSHGAAWAWRNIAGKGPTAVEAWRGKGALVEGCRLRSVAVPWGDGDFEDGWFGGMLDGEGTIERNPTRQTRVSVSQREGPVWDRLLRYLSERGYSFSTEMDRKNPGRASKFGKRPVPKALVYRTDELFRLVGQTRPRRFMDCRFWEGRTLPFCGPVKIVSIEPLGERDMVDIETTSGTYIAEGFVSHNSSFWSAFIWSDLDVNPGASAAVTAHQDKTLKALNQNYRTFLGREKAKEKGRARRMADAIIETMGGSRVELLAGNDSLGRGGSYTHVHVSEGDYLAHLNDAMDSVLASMVKSEWATGVVESTIRRGSSTEFKAMVEQTLKEQERLKIAGDSVISFLDEAWRVRFISWMDDETARLTLTDEQARLFEARVRQRGSEMSEYESSLLDKYGADIQQVAWWHRMCKQDARGDVARMVEMYPVSLDEALTMVAGASFYRSEAIEFYRSILRPPRQRYRVSFDGLKTTTEFGFPTLDVYKEPQPHHRYVIGADPAWADNREGSTGSMAYFVVFDMDTGDQAAEMYGHMSPQDFAVGIWRAAQYYHDALVVPEVGPGTGGPDDYLRGVLGYHNVAEREKYGRMTTTLSGVYGFRTDNTTRSIIVSRLQNAFNDCKLGIYSRTLLDHMLNLGRHNGMPTRNNRSWRDEHDDGALATALALAPQRVHNLSTGWSDKRMKGDAPRESSRDDESPFSEWLELTRPERPGVGVREFAAFMDG